MTDQPADEWPNYDEPDFTAYYHCRPCRHHWYTGWAVE